MINTENTFESPLYVDTLYQGINSFQWRELFDIVEKKGFSEKRHALFSGKKINQSENRAVLHTALRNLTGQPVLVDGEDIMPAIQSVWRQMEQCCNKFVGITDIIHIGIGGSDFGPRLVCDALWTDDTSAKTAVNVHFLSNIDSADLARTLARAKPQSTRVIIVSKTFTTLETMQNAQSVLKWLSDANLTKTQISNLLYAVTTNVTGAL